jgi:cell division protein ZapA (FtsZ GTPase activity inhibitor)
MDLNGTEAVVKIFGGLFTGLAVVGGLLWKVILSGFRSEIAQHEERENAGIKSLAEKIDAKVGDLDDKVVSLRLEVTKDYAPKSSLEEVGRRFDDRMKHIDDKLDRILELLIRR